MQEELFTPLEVAERLKVTRQAVYRWMKDGKLDYVYVGSDRRITASALAGFIKASTEAGKAEEAAEKNEAPGQLMFATN
jgi:excisionase family DNA binding protein